MSSLYFTPLSDTSSYYASKLPPVTTYVTSDPYAVISSPYSDTYVVKQDILSYFPLKQTVYSDDYYLPSVNLSYTRPTLSIYDNLNADPEIHQKMAKYFKYKVLDKWLYTDLKSLLGYVTVSGDKVSFINKLSDYKENLDESKNIVEMKVHFLEKNLLSSRASLKILNKFVAGTNTNWYDLTKNEFFVKQAYEIAIKKMIKKMIAK